MRHVMKILVLGVALVMLSACGDPSKGDIITKAENAGTKADLVVMGTYGHSGIDHMVFGSTTERVLKKVKCPLLAIHPKSS